MLEMLRRKRDNEEGFTLIELMVVVLIIGILLAIAVPTFLSAQTQAKNKAATSNLRQGLSAAKTVYAETSTYAIGQTELKAAEPSLGWGATELVASTGPDVLSWDSVSGTAFAMAMKSKAGDCYFIKDDIAAAGGITYAKATVASCVATAMPTGTSSIDTGW